MIEIPMRPEGISIGIIADTHCEPGSFPVVPDAAVQAMRKADLVVHLGDIVARSALDRLSAVCVRTVAVRSKVDPPADQETIFEAPLPIKVGDRTIVAISDPADLSIVPGGLPACVVDDMRSDGQSIDVLAYRGSHTPVLGVHDGCLMVDPGSPTAYRDVPTVACVVLGPNGVTVDFDWLSSRLDRTTKLLRLRDGVRMRLGDRSRDLIPGRRGGRR